MTWHELGPRCEQPGCEGVLRDTIRWTTTPPECFRQCSKCGARVHVIPLADKLAYGRRGIERAVKGERTS